MQGSALRGEPLDSFLLQFVCRKHFMLPFGMRWFRRRSNANRSCLRFASAPDCAPSATSESYLAMGDASRHFHWHDYVILLSNGAGFDDWYAAAKATH